MNLIKRILGFPLWLLKPETLGQPDAPTLSAARRVWSIFQTETLPLDPPETAPNRGVFGFIDILKPEQLESDPVAQSDFRDSALWNLFRRESLPMEGEPPARGTGGVKWLLSPEPLEPVEKPAERSKPPVGD